MEHTKIPTGVKIVDSKLEGGVSKGEVAVIVGKSCTGKTTLVSRIGAMALASDYRVVHISFEDEFKYVVSNYRDLLYSWGQVYKMKDLFTNRLEMDKVSVRDLKCLVDSMIADEMRPDVVIIDGLMWLKCSGKANRSGRKLQELKELAKKLNVVVWVTANEWVNLGLGDIYEYADYIVKTSMLDEDGRKFRVMFDVTKAKINNIIVVS